MDLRLKALKQLDDESFFKKVGDTAILVLVILKHISVNLLSRFSYFPVSDGEKSGATGQ